MGRTKQGETKQVPQAPPSGARSEPKANEGAGQPRSGARSEPKANEVEKRPRGPDAPRRPAARSLQIKEIYRSIQGESSFAGWPCTFVRTTGCDIRCVYCDEAHAFSGGERLPLDEVVKRVTALGAKLVEITGGEPLLQRAVPELARRLLDSGHEVLIESGGHRDITEIDPRARLILDVKTPGSGMQAHNHLENLERLRPHDEVKFVLIDRADYEWARDFVRDRALHKGVPVHFSPVHPGLSPRDLCAWILEDGLPVRLNLQLHKYIWGPEASGV